MDEDLLLRELEREYCPPIDQALVHAFWSDYAGFPDREDAVRAVRELLDGIKMAALEEEGSGFDPSGSSGVGDAGLDGARGGEYAEGNAGTETEDAGLTDPSRTRHARYGDTVYGSKTDAQGGTYTDGSDAPYTESSSRSGIGYADSNSNSNFSERVSESTDDSVESGCFKDSEHLDTQSKEGILAQMFPTLPVDFVLRVLKKYDDCLSKASDELLNQVYFADAATSPADDVVVPRGIDAFSEDWHVPQRKKGKGKGKKRGKNKLGVDAEAEDTDMPPPSNKWLHGTQHVDFIASRTKIPSSTVSSLYHRNGASVPATITALIEKDLEENRSETKEPDAEDVQNALDLIGDFPQIDLEYAIALIRLTSPSTTNAQELAKAMTNTSQPSSAPSTPTTSSASAPPTFRRGSKQTIQVLPRYAPLQLSDPTPVSQNLPSLAPSAVPQTTASLTAARAAHFNQASSAFRRGKSDHLMKGAAAYYSQVARDYHAHIKAYSESDADALVQSQSSSGVLDLHGVCVADAVRIATAKVKVWWEGLGESRIPGYGGGSGGKAGGGRAKNMGRGVGGEEGYRIITGLGRHSEGGKAKLGPAVVRALVREGWKVEVGGGGGGEVIVTGLARRR